MLQVTLPVLGKVNVRPDPKEKGHYWWQSSFGFHDCTRAEDGVIESLRILNSEFGEETLPSPNGKRRSI